MRFIFAFAILLLNVDLVAHDIAIAKFNLSAEGNQIFLEMEFDLEDFQQAIFTELGHENIDHQVIQAYLEKHTTWNINGEILPLKILEVNKDAAHYYVKATLGKWDKAIEYIKIKNTCLIHQVEHHSNIIYANFYGRNRGFRMNEKRVEIMMDYRA